MKIHLGFQLTFDCPQPTPMILMLNVHPSRVPDLLTIDNLVADPPVPISVYRDSFGNRCTRIVAPTGMLRLSTDTIINDSGLADPVNFYARETPVEALPDDVLQFLLGSRFCEIDPLLNIAWGLFGNSPSGWARVQTICDYVNQHIAFDYQRARPTKTAWDVFHERQGVCRDFAHLAVALCRCMNIPARYCTGYLGDMGIPPPYGEMDFAAWFEAYLDGQWYIFDPRNNMPRIGRILMGRGRDAADVAFSTAFGLNTLQQFKVVTDELVDVASVNTGNGFLQNGEGAPMWTAVERG
jgi:transglutaminase-like putative cysteine protease